MELRITTSVPNKSGCDLCCEYKEDLYQDGEALYHGSVSLHCVKGDIAD